MTLFKRSTKGFFASESLAGHLLRGGVAITLLFWAIQHQAERVPSLLAAAGALIAFRGCPICWSIGLVETLVQKLKRHAGNPD
jgi:hypothetical protein